MLTKERFTIDYYRYRQVKSLSLNQSDMSSNHNQLCMNVNDFLPSDRNIAKNMQVVDKSLILEFYSKRYRVLIVRSSFTLMLFMIWQEHTYLHVQKIYHFIFS